MLIVVLLLLLVVVLVVVVLLLFDTMPPLFINAVSSSIFPLSSPISPLSSPISPFCAATCRWSVCSNSVSIPSSLFAILHDCFMCRYIELCDANVRPQYRQLYGLVFAASDKSFFSTIGAHGEIGRAHVSTP